MTRRPHLIVMLTHHDCTVRNAYEIFEQCKRSRTDFWVFKEQPLPLTQIKTLYTYYERIRKNYLSGGDSIYGRRMYERCQNGCCLRL